MATTEHHRVIAGLDREIAGLDAQIDALDGQAGALRDRRMACLIRRHMAERELRRYDALIPTLPLLPRDQWATRLIDADGIITVECRQDPQSGAVLSQTFRFDQLPNDIIREEDFERYGVPRERTAAGKPLVVVIAARRRMEGSPVGAPALEITDDDLAKLKLGPAEPMVIGYDLGRGKDFSVSLDAYGYPVLRQIRDPKAEARG